MYDSLFQNIGEFMATHRTLALLLLFAAAAGESLFVVGLFVPGMVVLVGAGALVGGGKLPFLPVYLLAVLGAFLGNIASYWIGRHFHGGVRKVWPFSRYPDVISYGEAFFERHGPLGLFLSHFVPGVKTVVPGVAGMMGMGAVRFALITAVSVVIWAAAVLLPSIGLGLGISSLGAANPRLIALLVAVVVTLWIAYRLAWLVAGRLWPIVVGYLRQGTGYAVARGWPGARAVDAVAHNRGRIVTPIIWVAAAGFAIAGFVDLSLDLTMGKTLAASDQAISNLIQSFRTPPADSILVAITMIGDSAVLTALVAVMLGVLLIYREWRVAGAAAVAIAATSLFVPFVKDLLQRARPQLLYSGADAFSFPSGHASLSMAVAGVIAVLLAHRLRRRQRLTVYAVAVTVAVLIGFSRIYLAAHWPSDVAAGLMFGAAVVSAFALSLHNRLLAVKTVPLALALGATFLVAYTIHLDARHASWVRQYVVEAMPETMTLKDWLNGGWKNLPQRRIELSGETGEAMLVQTDAPPDVLGGALTAAGWNVETTPGLGIMAALPAGTGLSERPPLPLFHDGRPAELTATHPLADGSRTVLRLWPSGYATADGRPILVGSMTGETLRSLPLGFYNVDDTDIRESARQRMRDVFLSAPGLRSTAPNGPAGPLLVTPARPGGVAAGG